MKQLQVLDKQFDRGSRFTLLKLWVEDVVRSGGELEEVLVRLDEALCGGQLHTPKRLSWSQRVGADRFGVFADVEVGSVSFKMRWIPAGRFLMGSPENEEGRYEDEGPQHEVRLTEGYWLCEVPCTQVLWEAVMGKNPSRFNDRPEHPVERVSWDDCQSFLRKLNEKVPGLDAELPTEAQWEYACCAGSQEARYGELEKVAWYRENSDQQTHPVGRKAPNAWGLYDMLGNVWEWCVDGMRDYKKGPVADPVGPQDEGKGAERMIRGGYWRATARYARAAKRYCFGRGIRLHSLGFRLSRGQKTKKTIK